jgi:endonuclease III
MKDFFKVTKDGVKIYWMDNKQIGEKIQTIRHIMSKTGVSSSKAHKIIDKIKEYSEKVDKNVPQQAKTEG